MQFVGMRQTAVAEPEFLVETFGVDDESVAFPLPYRSTIIERVIGIAAELTLLLPAIGIDDPVIAVATPDENKYPFTVAVFCKLDAVRQLILTRAARRHAKHVHR